MKWMIIILVAVTMCACAPEQVQQVAPTPTPAVQPKAPEVIGFRLNNEVGTLALADIEAVVEILVELDNPWQDELKIRLGKAAKIWRELADK